MSAYKRVLLKLSGEILMGDQSYGISTDTLNQVALIVKDLYQTGCEIGIVIGGGNIFRGLAGSEAGFDRVNGDHMGMLATIINALALNDALNQKGVPSTVATSIELSGISPEFNAKDVRKKLAKKEVVIFGGGTGNPFFTTDTAAALRAAEIQADLFIKATKVDGVYDKDPEKHADAIKYDTVSFTEVLINDLKVMDATAISLCRENNVPIIVCSLFEKNNITNAVAGIHTGTLVKGE